MRRSRLAAAGTTAGVVGLGFAASASAADFPVSNNLNTGAGSLRAAVTAANGSAGADTISFTSAVSQIELASPISITGPVAVNGPTAGQVRVDGNNSGIFDLSTVPAGTDVELSNLALIDADAPSAIFSGAANVDLAVRSCAFTGNNTSGSGASISAGASGSTVTISDSTFTGGYVGFDGGAILARGALVVSGSTFTGNDATLNGGAIWSEGSAVISGSTFTGNRALAGEGGAIRSAGPLTIVDSKITGNRANGGDGGGGVFSSGAVGDTVIRDTTVSGNSTTGGGGGLYFGYGGGVQIEGSTFSGNSSASSGGGVYVYAPDGPFTVTDSTIAGNTTLGKGGGVYSFGYYDNEVTFTAATIANNVATGSGSGIFQFGYDGQGAGYEGPDQISLRSTLVADNVGSDLAQGPSAVSPFEADFSLIGATGGVPVHETTAGSNKLNTGVIPLPPLADNGGPTATILPAAGSAAVDSGKAYGSGTDQRGLARTVQQPGADAPGSDGTDIGAAELGDSSLDGARLNAKKRQKEKGRKVVVAVEVGADEAVTATATGTVKLGKKKLELGAASADVEAGERVILKLKPAKKRSLRKIAKALAAGKKAKATVSVAFIDGAGNEETRTAKVKLLAKTGGK